MSDGVAGLRVVTGRRWYGPRFVASGRGELAAAAALCVCLGSLLAFDLAGAATNQVGNPLAVVVLVAALAGWVLRARWAVPLWVLSAGLCAVAVVAGDVPPLNAVAIALGAVVAGIGSHVGSTALSASQAALDRQVDLIRRASALVAGTSDPRAALDEILRVTVAIMADPSASEDVGAAVLALEDGGPRPVATAGSDPVPALGLDDPERVRAAGPLADLLRDPRHAVTDASGHAALARIDAAGKPWGVLVVRRPGGRLRHREVVLVGAVADLAGAAIDSRRRAGDLERLRDRLQVTLDLAVEIGSSLDPAGVGTAVLRRACTALDADRATLARMRGAETEVVAVYEPGSTRQVSWAGDRFPTELLLEQAPVRDAIERRTPAAGGALALDAAMERYRDDLGDVRAVLAMPLLARDELVGLLTLSRNREAPFTDDDRVTVSQFGSVSVLALMNSWAHAELERERRSAAETARQLSVAVEAAKDVGFETELDQVTRRLLVRSAQAVGAERGSIGRIDGDRLIVEADWAVDGEPGPAGRTMSLAGVPGLLDTLRSGQPFRQSIPAGEGGETAARHGLQCPLMAGGELVGVMTLSRGAAGPFDDAELDALQQLTSLTALTLRSARQLAVARLLGQAKNEFLNMAAHELRTPLAVVRGYLSMLADGTLEVPETTRRGVVSVLCDKTDELSAMIEQILAAVQIQTGGVQLQRQVFDLGDAIAAAIERARPRAVPAGVELWCQPLPGPVRVDAVRRSVDRILDNLIANAITYGNQLPVRLSVEVTDQVLVRVEDQGIGVSPEQQERLFEPFFRVDQPSVQGPAGAGLGLAVSRRLAELSGGSLDLEWTQPGAGSTFVLRLPAAAEPAEHHGERAP